MNIKYEFYSMNIINMFTQINIEKLIETISEIIDEKNIKKTQFQN